MVPTAASLVKILRVQNDLSLRTPSLIRFCAVHMKKLWLRRAFGKYVAVSNFSGTD